MEVSVYCTIGEVPPKDFAHRVISRDRGHDRKTAEHLDRLFARLQATPSANPILFSLLRHLDRTRDHFRLEIEDDSLSSMQGWLERSYGVVEHANGEITDPQGRLLHSPTGRHDPLAELPRSILAQERRERTVARLRSENLALPDDLCLVPSEAEVLLRDAAEIAERCLALFLVALRAGSLATTDAIPVDEMRQLRPQSFSYLTPEERSFLDETSPHPDSSAAMSWRYEALTALLWGIGLQELPPAYELCSVEVVFEQMLRLDEQDFLHGAHRRDTGILLDALDLSFCQHWLCRQAELEERPPAASLDPGIVSERLYALSWLTRFEPCDWDDIGIPTDHPRHATEPLVGAETVSGKIKDGSPGPDA